MTRTGPTVKRQTSLAAFLAPKAKSKIPAPSSSAIKRERSSSSPLVPIDQAISLDADLHTDEEPPLKRQKRSPSPPYPSRSHPSYHLPPRADFNHPFPIAPVPSAIRDHLSFNTLGTVIDKPPDLDLVYYKRFIDPSVTRALTKYLLDSLPWQRVRYTVRGIHINTPRYTTVFGKDSTDRPWTGYKSKPRAIPDVLLLLMKQVEKVTGATFNFALVNYYASGSDSISFHSDSESFLGPNPTIASLSLGAPRDFHMRHVDYRTNGVSVEKMVMHDGDMVVMKGTTQHKWQHSVPKRKSAEGRINITFRKGIVPYATENYNTYNVGQGGLWRWDGRQMMEQKVSGRGA